MQIVKFENTENLEFVMIRTNQAGTHYGYLKYANPLPGGNYEVVLVHSRRMWGWAGGNCLSELATLGSFEPLNCKFSIPTTSHKMMAIEIITITDKAKENLENIPYWIFAKV